MSFRTVDIRREPGGKYHILVVKVQVHAAIVNERCLVDIEPFTTIRFEEHRGLHTGGREIGGGEVRLTGLLLDATDLTQFAARIFILLRIVVTRDPIGSNVTRHRELGMLLFDNEIVEVPLLREDIAEAETIVIKAETDLNRTIFTRLLKGEQHLVVAVSN